jgi:hypothetical protein
MKALERYLKKLVSDLHTKVNVDNEQIESQASSSSAQEPPNPLDSTVTPSPTKKTAKGNDVKSCITCGKDETDFTKLDLCHLCNDQSHSACLMKTKSILDGADIIICETCKENYRTVRK